MEIRTNKLKSRAEGLALAVLLDRTQLPAVKY